MKLKQKSQDKLRCQDSAVFLYKNDNGNWGESSFIYLSKSLHHCRKWNQNLIQAY